MLSSTLLKQHNLPILSLILAIFAFFFWQLFDVLPISLVSKLRLSLPFIIVCYIYLLYTTQRRYGFFNVFFMLLALSLFFYYGQHFVVLFDINHLYKINEDSIISKILSDDVYVKATYIVIISLLVMHAGFFCVKNTQKEWIIKPLNQKKLKSLRIAGWFGLLISVYPMIRYQVSLFALQMTLGYGGRRQLEGDADYLSTLGVSSLIIYLADLFVPSLYALLIGYKGRKHKAIVYTLIFAYLGINLVLGSRFMILKVIVVLLFIQFVWISPPDKKMMKKLVVAGVVLVVIFSLLTKLRGMTSDSVSMSDAAEGVGISSVLWETGITFTCVSTVLAYCPSKIDFTWGASVVGAFLQCLPEPMRFGYFDNHTLLLSSIFSPLYYNSTLIGFGSSFIAEGYWNFGYFLFLYMFLLGIVLAKMTKMLNTAQYTSSPYLFLVLSSVCGDLAFGVRNDLSAIPRMILTHTFVILIIAISLYILMNSSNRKVKSA